MSFKSCVTRCTTSRDHLEADGLAKRMVQTVKKALRKYGLQKGHLGDWDIQSPWLAMGYRFTRQASLASFSPYFLLYGRDPDLPAAIRRESCEVVNLDDPDMWMRVCSQRAELFRRVMPMAFENLAIAQHRDMFGIRPFRVEVINHQFVGSMWGTMSICSRLRR